MPANIGFGGEGGIRGIRGKIRTRLGAFGRSDVSLDLGRPSASHEGLVDWPCHSCDDASTEW
jgi:hypothetical protein